MSGWPPNCSVEIANRRASMLARARRYFEEQGVMPVDTPSLSSTTVSDPQLTSLQLEDGLYLQTSPESFMKRLLAAGYPDIYSICRVYRGAESGKRHLPEFTMIEWYRHIMGLGEIIDDTTALIAAVLDQPDLKCSVVRRNYVDVFVETLGVEPMNSSIDALADVADADGSLRQSIGDYRDTWLDLILATRIAPTFSNDCLTIVQHYPASQAALSRLCPDNDQVADRFEVFYGALELANGYVELTSADEQAARMDSDLIVRRDLGKTQVPRDTRLLAALESGLPECAGVALGFERLQMTAEHTDDIRNIVTFAEGFE